jgi:hypothetical protein
MREYNTHSTFEFKITFFVLKKLVEKGRERERGGEGEREQQQR